MAQLQHRTSDFQEATAQPTARAAVAAVVQDHRLTEVLAQDQSAVQVVQVFRLARSQAAQRRRLLAVVAAVRVVAAAVEQVQMAAAQVLPQVTVLVRLEQPIVVVAVVAVTVRVQVVQVLRACAT